MLRLGILNLYYYSSTYPAYPMQDRTYLVSEKLAHGKASSAKHTGTPVPTDTLRERNTSPEPQQLVMLCGMGMGLASASLHPPACYAWNTPGQAAPGVCPYGLCYLECSFSLACPLTSFWSSLKCHLHREPFSSWLVLEHPYPHFPSFYFNHFL